MGPGTRNHLKKKWKKLEKNVKKMTKKKWFRYTDPQCFSRNLHLFSKKTQKNTKKSGSSGTSWILEIYPNREKKNHQIWQICSEMVVIGTKPIHIEV